MTFDGDQRAPPEFFAMLLENKNEVFAIDRTKIIESQLDNTG